MDILLHQLDHVSAMQIHVLHDYLLAVPNTIGTDEHVLCNI